MTGAGGALSSHSVLIARVDWSRHRRHHTHREHSIYTAYLVKLKLGFPVHGPAAEHVFFALADARGVLQGHVGRGVAVHALRARKKSQV